MQRKIYRRWDDIPQYFRENVMKVISLNKINFNNSLVRRAQTEVWICEESSNSNNGWLRYDGETYVNIYRLPDIDNISIYISIDYDGNIMTIDFYDKTVGRVSYISIKGGIRR